MTDNITADERINRLLTERDQLKQAPGPWQATLVSHPISNPDRLTHLPCCVGSHETSQQAYRCAAIALFLGRKRMVQDAGGPVAHYVMTQDGELSTSRSLSGEL